MDEIQPFLKGHTSVLADVTGQYLASLLIDLAMAHPEAKQASFTVRWDGSELAQVEVSWL